MPHDQHGAVALSGTDFASHIISTAIDIAALLSLSMFVLFVDLTKVFDKVIKQLPLGWGGGTFPPASACPIFYLSGFPMKLPCIL